MSFIIVIRNPRNKKLDVIIDSNGICEFKTEDDADIAAAKIQSCLAWGYEILEVKNA